MRYFSTWSELQRHLREEHPPTCPYPECHAQTFSAQKGLRAHLRIHQERTQDDALHDALQTAENDPDDGERHPIKRPRRGGNVGRDWICSVGQCTMGFKSVSLMSPLNSFDADRI